MSSNLTFHCITFKKYLGNPKKLITYGRAPCKFGLCLLGIFYEKICHLALFDEDQESLAFDNLVTDWPGSVFQERSDLIAPLIKEIFEDECKSIKVLLRGTPLQCEIWKHLTKVPRGKTTSYEQVARAVGHPKAARAVAGAIAANKIAYLIPCHRVIKKDGIPHKYRWGAERKIHILKFEAEQN